MVSKEKWDERFAVKDYVYGTEPNSFFKNEIDKLKPGRGLFVGEGEGRNAIYAAKLNWEVDALDISEEAKKKAEKLAKNNNVTINYEVLDIKDCIPKTDYYDLAVIIFAHFEPEIREKIHLDIVQSLKKGGRIILEVYEKEQLKYKSGGPKIPELLYSLEDVYTDFNELDVALFSKEIITLNEGILHQGKASVIRYVGTKT
ncbi:class I SAM-dependent methyltransferase [Bacteroidota bacterium]